MTLPWPSVAHGDVAGRRGLDGDGHEFAVARLDMSLAQVLCDDLPVTCRISASLMWQSNAFHVFTPIGSTLAAPLCSACADDAA